MSSGSTSANTSSMPRSAATASATCRASPVIITTRMPSSWSCSTASRASGRTWSSSANAPTTFAVSDEVEHRRAAAPPGSVCRRELGGHVEARARAAGPARRPRPASRSTVASTPRPVIARKSLRRAGSSRARARRRRSRGRADARSRPRPRPPARARRRGPGRGDAGDDVLAARQRARLVEQHGVDEAPALEAEPVLDEDAAARGERGRDRDHERDREPERVRAGDHEHGDRADHGGVDVAERAPTRRR